MSKIPDHNLPRQLKGISHAREYLADLGFNLVGWILVGLAGLILVRALAIGAMWLRPGSIDLRSVTNAGDSPSGPAPATASDPAVVAQLQDRLAGRSLFGSAAMPTGAVPNVGITKLTDALAKAVSASQDPASGIASLIGFLPSLIPKSGLTIDAVMRVGELDPRSGCTITLTDQATGRVVALRTHWDETPLLAVDGAVLFAIAYVSDMRRFQLRTPLWSRFGVRNEKALVAYVRGEDCGRVGKLDEALKAYNDALVFDPGNLTIAMKVASTQELLAAKARASEEGERPYMLDLRDAAASYRRAGKLWTEALAPRYRLALVLGQLSLRADAQASLARLQRDLRFRTLLRKWVRTFLVPRYAREGTRSYFRRLLAPATRSNLQKAYSIAEFVVSDADGSRDETEAVESLLRRRFGRPKANWQVKYNAACYYSRRENYVAANDLITEVLRDPRSGLTGTWLASDPDLEGLRRWQGEAGVVNVIPRNRPA